MMADPLLDWALGAKVEQSPEGQALWDDFAPQSPPAGMLTGFGNGSPQSPSVDAVPGAKQTSCWPPEAEWALDILAQASQDPRLINDPSFKLAKSILGEIPGLDNVIDTGLRCCVPSSTPSVQKGFPNECN